MIPVDMTTVHSPPDSVGDCFRCCIASILELPAVDVPHFYDGEGFADDTGRIGRDRLRAWLKPMGYFFLEVEFEVDWLDAWQDAGALDCHYVFSGISSRGQRHATVGYKGRLAHDPHPDRSGVLPDKGKYCLGFVVKR